MFYIYKITNTKNGKFYIGKSGNLDKRWYQHIYDSKVKPTYFGRAICKYGEDAFDLEIIDSHEDESVAYSLETYWINKLRSRDPDIGYNLAEGGKGGFCGVVLNEETRKKISTFHKSRPRKPMGEETKSKIKEARSKQNRKILDIDFKNQILQMYRTNNYTKQQVADRFEIELKTVKSVIRQGVGLDKFEPYKMPEERKKKISETNLGRQVSNETRKKLSLALSGRKTGSMSKEHKEKIKTSLNNRYSISEDLKNNIIKDFKNLLVRKEIARRNEVSIDCVDKITKGMVRDFPRSDHKLSKEQKLKISKANAGRCVSEESRKKISIANSGNGNGMFGRTHSNEAKMQMSKKQRERNRPPISDDQKEKLSVLFKGKPRPPLILEPIKNDVRNDYSSGNFTKRQLSEKYNIKYGSIVNILRNKL